MEKRRPSDGWLVAGWIIVGVSLPWGAWLYWHIPTPGKAGMLLALVATILPLVWEDVRAFCRAGLILALVLLVAVEYRAINNEHQQAAADTLKIITNTQTSVERLKEVSERTKISTDSLASLVTQTTLLLSQMTATQRHLADLDIKINAAKEKHDPKLIADLQDQAASAHQALNSLSKDVLLAMVPPITQQLREWSSERRYQERNS